MSYNAPSAEAAFRLFDEISGLLQKSGGYYAEGLNSYAEACILCCIAAGQFRFKRNAYFVCWYFISDNTLEKIHNKDSSVFEHMPTYDMVNGRHMRVMECGCLDRKWIPEIRRKLRRCYRGGVSWYREKTKRQICHYTQAGG